MLSRMKNSELDYKIKSLAQQERELLREVLEYIKEADTRRIYLDLAFPSMFSYLVEGCGYSAGAAQRRIDAARLLRIEPQLAEKIQSGEINLGQVSLLQKAIREKDKIAKVTSEEKRNLIAKLSQKTLPQTQRIISSELELEIKECPRETYQKNESVRLEVTLTKEQWEKLKEARELASNATQSNDWSVLFEYLADRLIRQKKSTATVAVKSVTLKRAILNRDQSCQFQSEGKICGSRWNLNIDHIRPRWAGGGNAKDNLRVLCQKHNNHLYRQQTGMRLK